VQPALQEEELACREIGRARSASHNDARRKSQGGHKFKGGSGVLASQTARTLLDARPRGAVNRLHS
jgi:hypothetical protein